MRFSAVAFCINDAGGDVLREILKREIAIKLLVTRNNPEKKENDPQRIALKEGIPFEYIESFDKRIFKTIEKINPDFLISGWFHLKIPTEIIKLSKRVSVNLHPSLLPAYRGATPVEWCVMNGETTTGLTLHKLEERFDSGEILWKEKISILPDETTGEVLRKIRTLIPFALDHLLLRAVKNNFSSVPQDENKSSYFPKRTINDANLDFRWDAIKIHNRVRAMNPYPLARFTIGATEYKVLRSKIASENTVKLKPGSVIEIKEDGCSASIVCGDRRIVEFSGINPPNMKVKRKNK